MNETILELLSKIPVILVDDIFDYVYNDDKEYALSMKEQLSNIYGICYVNRQNKIEILAAKDQGINIIATIYHEKVHALDYLRLSYEKNVQDIRFLQEDYAFLYWTEFHATYTCYKNLVKEFGYKEGAVFFAKDIYEEVKKWMNRETLILKEVTDFFVREFGKYMVALEDEKEQLPAFPDWLFINKDFRRVYNYLYDHRTFDSIKDNIEEFRKILKNLESSSK